MSPRSLLRKLIPRSLLDRYGRYRRSRQRQVNSRRTAEEVFTKIYEQNAWGGTPGEFCSGTGSDDEHVVAAYVAAVSDAAARERFQGLSFVDLGCGDFRVGRQLMPLCSSYVGVDVVRPLVRRNQEKYGSATTRFVHLDIADDALPDGDVCLVRQVLQHLSNRQIANVLRKLDKYRWVLITEHYPTANDGIEPNRDKAHGGDVRVYDNSGVYLTEPPFGLPGRALEQILEVPGVGLGEDRDPGVIRTFLYRPGA